MAKVIINELRQTLFLFLKDKKQGLIFTFLPDTSCLNCLPIYGSLYLKTKKAAAKRKGCLLVKGVCVLMI
jgi:hypothetical protein